MDTLIRTFSNAQSSREGYHLAQTLSPDLPQQQLQAIWKSCGHHDAQNVIKRGIQNSTSGFEKLPKDEVQGWTDVYLAYWKAIGELLPALNQAPQSSWTKVYDAWKDLLSALYRGYIGQGFEAWSIPCLYVVAKNLRIFALKADEERNNNVAAGDTSGQIFQDDFDPESEQHQKLEDCARQLNRIFTLCLNDRYSQLLLLSHYIMHVPGMMMNLLTDTCLQGPLGGVTKMGHLLHHQSFVQDVL